MIYPDKKTIRELGEARTLSLVAEYVSDWDEATREKLVRAAIAFEYIYLGEVVDIDGIEDATLDDVSRFLNDVNEAYKAIPKATDDYADYYAISAAAHRLTGGMKNRGPDTIVAFLTTERDKLLAASRRQTNGEVSATTTHT